MKKYGILLLLILFCSTLPGQELRIEEHREFPKTTRVIDAKFSSFRNYFALTKIPYTFEVYDRNWNQVFKHSGSQDRSFGEFCFSPDERFLALASYKGLGDIGIVSLKDMKVIQLLRGHNYRVNDLQFSHNNNFLASVEYSNKLIIWKLEGNRFSKHQEFIYNDEVSNVEFSFDDNFLLTADDNGYVTVYKYVKDKYEVVQKIKCVYSYLYGLDYHPSRHEFVTGNSAGLLRYRMAGDRFLPLDSLKNNLDVSNDINYSPTGKLLTIPDQNDITILDMESSPPRQVDAIYRHDFRTFCARFSDDGQYLASSAADSLLIIWEISPIEPSRRSQISSWVNDRLTSAQRKILTYDVVNDIYNGVDKTMTEPRDEFETTAEYEKRHKVLEEWTLSIIQKKTEEKYELEPEGKSQVKIPVQDILGYNADKEIYKIRFLETEAGVVIPVSQAKSFREKWTRSVIIANKTRDGSAYSFSYSNFQLRVPGLEGTFAVTPVENPFNFNNRRSAQPSPDEPQASDPGTDESSTGEGIISHALLFATNVYDSFTELVNPVLDANTIAAELSENYGVSTEVVLNPSLSETADKLREYASRSYRENENLIVFFAGHGVYDQVFKEGYVISTDSRADDISKTSYLSHSNLRTMINNIGCRHIFLVMDVCFGGTIDPYLAKSSHRGAMEMYKDIPKEEFIERKTKYKSRLYLTSGGNEYVPDGRSGFHSPFARRFIEALRMYGGDDGILTTGEIMQYVEKVDPQPRFGEFGDNEPGSDFILISR